MLYMYIVYSIKCHSLFVVLFNFFIYSPKVIKDPQFLGFTHYYLINMLPHTLTNCFHAYLTEYFVFCRFRVSLVVLLYLLNFIPKFYIYFSQSFPRFFSYFTTEGYAIHYIYIHIRFIKMFSPEMYLVVYIFNYV